MMKSAVPAGSEHERVVVPECVTMAMNQTRMDCRPSPQLAPVSSSAAAVPAELPNCHWNQATCHSP